MASANDIRTLKQYLTPGQIQYLHYNAGRRKVGAYTGSDTQKAFAALTKGQQAYFVNLAVKRGMPVMGGSIFGKIWRGVKKVAGPALKVAAPIAIGIATRAAEKAITKKMGGCSECQMGGCSFCQMGCGSAKKPKRKPKRKRVGGALRLAGRGVSTYP